MNLLLDSHAVLWSLADPGRLRAEARGMIEDRRNRVFVSAASIWELRLKEGKGKLKLPAGFEPELERVGFRPLVITWTHSREACALPALHQDPFDRLLVAQAKAEGLVLATRDPEILRYEVAAIEV